MGLEVKRPNSFRSRAEDAPAALTAFSRYSALAVVPEAVAMPINVRLSTRYVSAHSASVTAITKAMASQSPSPMRPSRYRG